MDRVIFALRCVLSGSVKACGACVPICAPTIWTYLLALFDSWPAALCPVPRAIVPRVAQPAHMFFGVRLVQCLSTSTMPLRCAAMRRPHSLRLSLLPPWFDPALPCLAHTFPWFDRLPVLLPKPAAAWVCMLGAVQPRCWRALTGTRGTSLSGWPSPRTCELYCCNCTAVRHCCTAGLELLYYRRVPSALPYCWRGTAVLLEGHCCCGTAVLLMCDCRTSTWSHGQFAVTRGAAALSCLARMHASSGPSCTNTTVRGGGTVTHFAELNSIWLLQCRFPAGLRMLPVACCARRSCVCNCACCQLLCQ